MYSKDYCFKSTDKTNTFFKRYLKTYDDVPVIKIDKNTYLFKLDTSYDTLLYKKKNHFYFVSANFSLKMIIKILLSFINKQKNPPQSGFLFTCNNKIDKK